MRRMARGWAPLALVLALPVGSWAATKDDFRDMAVLIESLGQPDRSAQLLAAIDAIPDEDFRTIYGDVDLTPLAFEVERTVVRRNAAIRARARVEEQYRDASRAAEQMRGLVRTGTNGSLPEADYPVILPACPYHLSASKQAPPQFVMDTTITLQILREVLEQVSIAVDVGKGIWDGLSRGCEQVTGAVILGAGAVFNLSLACIPVDIVFAVLEFAVAEAQWGIELGQSLLDITEQCDGISSDATLSGTYDRTAHIHDDLDVFKEETDARLDLLQDGMTFVKRILLENQLTNKGGSRMMVNYVDRIEEVCLIAQQAIDEAIAAGYDVGIRPQQEHDAGELLIPTDPKAAHDRCKMAYRMAAVSSTSLR